MAQMWEFSKALSVYILSDFTKAIAINLTYRLNWPNLCLQPDFSPPFFLLLCFLG